MEITQYRVYLINPDPTLDHEIQKTRPCLVISPNEMNRHLQTVMIAPMTTKSHDYPTRVPLTFAHKRGWIVLDQIRKVDRRRLVKDLGRIENRTVSKVKVVLNEMPV